MRQSNEIELLKKFTEDIPFFKNIYTKMGKESHDQLCQVLGYDYLEKGETLFEIGKCRSGNDFIEL